MDDYELQYTRRFTFFEIKWSGTNKEPLIMQQWKLHFLIDKLNLPIVIEGDSKAPFSIATTPMCMCERHSFRGIAPPYPWYVLYNSEF